MKLNRREVLLIVLATLFATSESFKILAVFPTIWKSHWAIGASVLKNLAYAGHDVTFVSPYEVKNMQNFQNVILTNYPDVNIKNPFDLADVSPAMNFLILPTMLEGVLNFTLSHPNVQSLMNENFDVVIVESFHSEVLLGLGAHFKCPVIAVTTFGTSSYTNVMTATPSPASYVPNLFLRYTDKMNFLERLHNTIIWKLDEFHLYVEHYPRQRKLYEKYFPNAESFDKQRKNVALLLNNNYLLSSTVRPGMANVVDIGGVHVDSAKPLPNKIQEFLDLATDGVILFSMGSIIQGKDWPEEKREAFVKAFGKLKQKVLWKYENETLPNKPSNVMISPWIPQRDILAHPNVKLFITHGGLLGTTEAIVEGIPVLGIPIFGDQKMNMHLATSKGYAITLSYDDISEESVLTALKKVFSSHEISQKAKEVSNIYRDRPMSPQKSVVYWTEYVVRHKGAPHLRPAGLDLNYFELHSIDVYLTIVVSVVAVLISLKTFLKFIFRICFGLDENDQKLKIH